jgi:hypothetical protein
VYAPNGTLPLFNVEIFIPNAPLKPIPNGVQCSQCGDNVSGDPITTTYSLTTGEFTLTGVPAGKNIPIVVQLGKWRARKARASSRSIRPSASLATSSAAEVCISTRTWMSLARRRSRRAIPRPVAGFL